MSWIGFTAYSSRGTRRSLSCTDGEVRKTSLVKKTLEDRENAPIFDIGQ